MAAQNIFVPSLHGYRNTAAKHGSILAARHGVIGVCL